MPTSSMPLPRRAPSRLLRRSGAVAASAILLAGWLAAAGAAANGRLTAEVALAAKRVHAVNRDLDFFLTDSGTLIRSCTVARRDRTRGKLLTLATEAATMVGNIHDGPDRQLALLRGRLRTLLAPGASFGVDASRLAEAAHQLDSAAALVQRGNSRLGVALAAAGRGECATAAGLWGGGRQLQAALGDLDRRLAALRALA
jgi:hypothetical protein